MKILILGYGKMGKLIEEVCIQKKIEIAAKIDTTKELEEFFLTTEKNINNKEEVKKFYQNLICIDFSTAESFLININLLCDKKINTVCGTTGWYDKMEIVKKSVEKNEIGFLWGSNFSIGVNIFFKIVSFASKIMNNFNNFDVMVNEVHHKNKIDWPSGTSITTANLIIENFKKKEKILTEIPHTALNDNELFISATRGGAVFGEHSVIFDDEENQIQIKHIAKDKKSFASGAVNVAIWLKEKRGFFEIKDYYNFLI